LIKKKFNFIFSPESNIYQIFILITTGGSSADGETTETKFFNNCAAKVNLPKDGLTALTDRLKAVKDSIESLTKSADVTNALTKIEVFIKSDLFVQNGDKPLNYVETLPASSAEEYSELKRK